MQFIKNNPNAAALLFAAAAALLAIISPDLALAQNDDVWNAVTDNVAEPAIGLLTQIFFFGAVGALLIYGLVGMIQGNFDIQKMMKITAIAFAVVIVVFLLNDQVRPMLEEGIAGATGGSSSGLSLPSAPNF